MIKARILTTNKGDILANKRKPFNDYIIYNDYAEFIIINRKGIIFNVKVDLDDLQCLIKLNIRWFTFLHKESGKYYVRCSHRKPTDPFYLHDFIMNPAENQIVDHEDHNGLNNCKSNLRFGDKSSNGTHRKSKNSNNTSGYRNVS